MNEHRDVIDQTIFTLKEIAADRGHAPNWVKIENDLRAVFAQLSLDHSPVVRGLKGAYYRTPDASMTEAKEMLSEAKEAMGSAKSLPTLLSKFAARTYGNAGLISMPFETKNTYTDALAEYEQVFDTLERMFEETLSIAGTTKGMKGPLLERVVGTPIQHFLQFFIALWREATGRKVLGEKFSGAAKQLIEATLPDDKEIGDLKRQIGNAKRRGPAIRTRWTYTNEVAGPLLEKRKRHRGRLKYRNAVRR